MNVLKSWIASAAGPMSDFTVIIWRKKYSLISKLYFWEKKILLWAWLAVLTNQSKWVWTPAFIYNLRCIIEYSIIAISSKSTAYLLDWDSKKLLPHIQVWIQMFRTQEHVFLKKSNFLHYETNPNLHYCNILYITYACKLSMLSCWLF